VALISKNELLDAFKNQTNVPFKIIGISNKGFYTDYDFPLPRTDQMSYSILSRSVPFETGVKSISALYPVDF
jgi:hypothetical protein